MRITTDHARILLSDLLRTMAAILIVHGSFALVDESTTPTAALKKMIQ